MTCGATDDPATERARTYYNSDDADRFYHRLWGGEDIHIGIYLSPDEDVRTASHRTVRVMASRIAMRRDEFTVADLGSGYGGAARWLATRYPSACVTCVNLSEVQNLRNRERNKEAGLDGRISVIDGSFEDTPMADASVDVVWSQDAILHSSDRARFFREADRILRPGGEILFTDPMQGEDADLEGLQPVLDRLQLDSLGTVSEYRRLAGGLGWKELAFLPMVSQLRTHYARVKMLLEEEGESRGHEPISGEYLQKMLLGLDHWIRAADGGLLEWGIFHFRKPSAITA